MPQSMVMEPCCVQVGLMMRAHHTRKSTATVKNETCFSKYASTFIFVFTEKAPY